MKNMDLKKSEFIFYEFLCTNPLDNMETIRKMYTYYQSFSDSYSEAIYQYYKNYKFDERDGWSVRADVEKAYSKHRLLIRLMHDSYLAILLYRSDFDTYKKIIKGLFGYFECNDTEIIPPLKNCDYQTQEIVVTKEEYIQSLMILQHSSTNAGDYLYTSSLGSIIEIEKDIIKPDEKIKCLELKNEISYGDLNIFKQRNSK